jgi:hypothetical protein
MKSEVYKAYIQPAFLICAAVLGIAGGGMSMAIKHFNMHLKKDPLFLKRSLEFLDANGLGPYRVVSKSRIEEVDVIKELGTQDYIQWVLEDGDAGTDSSVRKCLLFITYYGVPDLVPHVPEECYAGSGYQRIGSESVKLELDISGRAQRLNGRYVVFGNQESAVWQGAAEFPVFYIFRVNGEYANTRDKTRFVLNKGLFDRYSYFSKIEWKFFNMGFGQAIYPNKEEAIAASEKLLAVLLPVLEKECWPEWPVGSGA